MGSRFPSHQLSNGLYVSGRPEQPPKERTPTMSSTAVPYTGGDIKKSGELGKMFDISMDSSRSRKSGPINNAPSRTGSFGGATSHLNQMAPNSGNRGSVSTSGVPGSASLKKTNSGPLNKHGEPVKKASGPQGGGANSVSRQNSGPLPPVLPATGLITSGPITSGPLNASGAPWKASGPLDSTGSLKLSSASVLQNQAVTHLSQENEHSFYRSFPKLIFWSIILLFVMGFIAGIFILAAVGNPILLVVVVILFVAVTTVFIWNSCWGTRAITGFIARYPDCELRTARDGQFVKVSGVVTCGNFPLESSFQKVPRCVYTSSSLYEYRGWDSKAANPSHRRFTWGLRSVERHVVDFYISDFQSGLRALVKAGSGAKVTPYVDESVVVDINQSNRDMSPEFIRWLGQRNLSGDDRVMRLKEGYIKEGSTVSIMGVVQRNDNVLMIVPPPEPIPTGCQWSKGTLDLSSLKIKEFPYFLRAMENLVSLDLSNNQIYGRIPEWVPSKWRDSLWFLNLTSNFLEGSLPLWICNSSSLRYLFMSSNNFSGVLLHCLGNLSDSLSRLDVSMNHFHGTIPSTLANLNNLRNLDLHGNQFEGMVPNLGNCTNLQTIDLGSNKLKDTFPRWLETLPQLSFLILRFNEFHGPIFISNISKTKYPFPNLQVMDLSNNEFRGEIPNVLGTFQVLEDLDLHKNNFRGTIPSTFAKGNLLRSLNLHDNHLRGGVPSSLANCTELEVLDLGKNQINDTFPNWLGTLPKLHILVLSFNRFHGPINTTSMNKNPFPKLRIIDLSGNEFSGLLPELFFKNFRAMRYEDENEKEIEYVGNSYYQNSVILVWKGVTTELERILTILTTIDLSSNKFEGEIPDVIGNLKFLRQLNLSHNSLVGRIPSLLGNLSKIESLDLNSNQLVGEIPQELANLNSLGTLNLSHNHLRGRIPSGKQFNTFLNGSYDGSLALCGFPLNDCKKGEVSQPPVVQEENDSDLMDGFTWKAVLMGYGCGTVLGFVIGYIMFLVGKPKWFTGIVEKEVRRKMRRWISNVPRQTKTRNKYLAFK